MSAETVCRECGKVGELKRGWTYAKYCSEVCERRAVARLHASMPGGPSPYPGWLPAPVDTVITQRWADKEAKP